MAKEFKDFDDKHRKLMGKLLEGEVGSAIAKRAETIAGWDHHSEITIWTNQEIREAVYESATADAWQQFRVSLKGFSTAMKLARVEARYLKIRDKVLATLEELGSSKDMLVYDTSLSEEEKIEKCRIDNYIGALRRGGQLDESYKIRK